MKHRITIEIVVWIQRVEHRLHLPPAAVKRLDSLCFRLLEKYP